MFDDEARYEERDGETLLGSFALKCRLHACGYVPAYQFITFC